MPPLAAPLTPALTPLKPHCRSDLVEAGLTRHDIGEIASKIGQLYYNFYLKTSSCAW